MQIEGLVSTSKSDVGEDYPPDIMNQFLRLTNVDDDEDNKLLAEVYLLSLFPLANLPKPMMIPHGIHGSGISGIYKISS